MHSYECQRGGMADAVDSKSTGNNLVGSTPTAGTNFFPRKSPPFAHGARVPAALPPGYGVFPGGPALRQSVRRLNRRTPYLRVWYFLFFYGLPSLTELGTFVRSAQKQGPFPGSPALRQSVRLTPYSLPSSMVYFLFCFNPHPSPTGLGSQRPCRRAMGYFPGAPLSVSPCGG